METLNIDAASFRQMEEDDTSGEGVVASPHGGEASEGDRAAARVRKKVLETIAARGKQHNPVTGSGGMLLGRVLQVAPGAPAHLALNAGDRVATLVSLSLTPLRVDAITAVRAESAQLDVSGEAVLFASGSLVKLPGDLPERLALAVLDVAGAAPQVARLVQPAVAPGAAAPTVLVLGGGGKSGILCVAEARRKLGRGGRVIAIESYARYADDLRALGLCDAVLTLDARDPVAVRRAVLEANDGREADVTFSCVNVPDTEMAAILATRDRGTVYFFAMSTSFTKAALGAEGVSKDVDLMIGNGYAVGHAEHTLAMMQDFPAVRALFESRYG
ncbi:L-erythro-3,5-diaminohexanoate dehydrogenase [Pendulispora albinea]|uniref:L-erythro-3,5-diaminohexanoate dehydrogenase n=1 Tax=Pendulispora albinea TaxID=2741071 RepID=A0ABZ2M4R0_9BACT